MATKKIIVAAVLCIAAIGTYTYIWKTDARLVREAMTDGLPKHFTLTYDNIRTEGFPLRVRTIIDNPVITVDAKALYLEHVPAVAHNGIDAVKVWTESLRFPAGLTVSRTPLSSAVTISETPGQAMISESVIDDHVLNIHIVSDKNEWTLDDVRMRSEGKGVDWGRLFIGHPDGLPFTGTIRSEYENMVTTIPGVDGEYRFKQGSVGLESRDDTLTLRTQARGVSATEAAINDAVQAHYSTLYDHVSHAGQGTLPRVTTYAGSLASIESADMTIRIDATNPEKRIVEYDMSGEHTDVTFDVKLHQAFMPDGLMSMDISGSQHTQERWYDNTKGDIAKFVADYIADEENHPYIEEYLKKQPIISVEAFKSDPEAFARTASQLMFRLVPRLHEWGKTTFSMRADGMYSDNSFMTSPVLHAFTFQADPYNINIKNISDNKDVLSLRVTAENYRDVIVDTVGYASRVVSAVSDIAPQLPGNIRIRDGLSDAAAAMLENIGERTDNTITMNVSRKGDMFMIGRRSVQQISGEAMLLLMPYISISVK